MTSSYYIDSLQKIRNIASGESVFEVVEHISRENPEFSSVENICNRINNGRNYPDTIHGLMLLINGVNNQKKNISELYELAMEKYSLINKNISAASKPTDDEIKIKGTLSDFIMKIESFFESQDRCVEDILSSLSGFLNESNLHGKTDTEVLYMNLSNFVIDAIAQSLNQMAENYIFYTENLPILKRLNSISTLILEERIK